MDLEGLEVAEPTPDDKILLVDEALAKLEQEDPEQAKVVVLKFFGGLTNKEVAENMGISERTVYRHWVCARARMFRWVHKAD